MKIILEAFNGKLRSKPMDVPDNIGHVFYMTLDLGEFKRIGRSGEILRMKPNIAKQCVFEYTGESEIDKRGIVAKVYQLVDIK